MRASWLIVALLAASCSSAGVIPSTATTQAISVPASTVAAAMAGGCPATMRGDPVGALVCDAPFVPDGATFTPPNDGESRAFEAAVGAALGGAPCGSPGQFTSLGLDERQVRVDDHSYLVVRERPGAARGVGVLIFACEPRRALAVEVPHVGLEDATLPEALVALRRGAMALFVNGTHRCAGTEDTPCRRMGSAPSTVCNGHYRIGDVAAHDRSYFQAAHRALLALPVHVLAVSLHGWVRSPERVAWPDAIVSDGTPLASGALSNVVAASLSAASVPARSCNSGEPTPGLLCGASNMQGRASNGAEPVCTASATSAASPTRFIHVEQDYAVIDRISEQVATSILDVSPVFTAP